MRIFTFRRPFVRNLSSFGAVTLLALAVAVPAHGQIVAGDFQIGSPEFFGPGGQGFLTNTGAQTLTRTADSRVFNLPLEVQFNSAYNLNFGLSPSQQFLYVAKSNPSGGLSTVCGGFPNQQIFMYELGPTANPIPFTSATGPACIEGPLSHQPRFYDELGVIRTMFLVGATDSGSGQNHAVLWADLVGRQMAINANTFGNGMDAIRFSPSGNAAFIIHGRSTIQTVYTFVDLCANPLGGGIGAAQNLPAGTSGATVTDLGGGSFQANVLVNGSIHPGSQVALSTVCFGGGIACCLPFANCDDTITGQECLNIGGSPVLGDCSTAECVEACCQPDGSCTLTDFASCLDPQGALTCDSVTCPVPMEACCDLGGFCQDLPPAQCIAVGNLPGGPGSSCSPNTCPVLAIDITKTGPATAYSGTEFTYTIDYDNVGGIVAQDAVLRDDLPLGVRFVSASAGGSDVGFNNIEWNLGTIPTTGPGSSGQVTVLARADCIDTFANNFARMTSTSANWQQGSNFVQTQILKPETDPVIITVTSVPANGLPVEGSALITHTISIENTLAVPRQAVIVSMQSGAGMVFESVLDAAGGTVDMFQTTQWDWQGDLLPSGTTDIVVTTRVNACINAVEVGLVNLFAYTACGEAIGTAVGPRLAVRRAIDVGATVTNIDPPTYIGTYQGETRYQIMRDGGTIDVLFKVGNPHPNPLAVTSGITLPFGFDAIADPPFFQPSDPGATWNAASRRVSWNGTLAPGQEVEVRFRAIDNGALQTVTMNPTGSQGTCTISDAQVLAVIPEMPVGPYLVGAHINRFWTFEPGVDTSLQTFFPFNSVYVETVGFGSNGDIWMLAFPTFRINPVTLELQGFPQSFLDNRLGFVPYRVAVDPSDGSALFAGVTSGPFNQPLAKIVRYDPAIDLVTPVFEEASSVIRGIFSILVEPNGMIGITGADQRLYRIDPVAGTATDISDTNAIANYGRASLDEDGSYLAVGNTFLNPAPLADVDPATGGHTVDVSDLHSLFPNVQFGFEEPIAGQNGDVYMRYQFNGIGVVHRQPALSSQELIPYVFNGVPSIGMSFLSPGLCVDGDGDGVPSGSGCAGTPDCDDANPTIYPGAVEINDGLDNQCPGETGAGQVDEITGWFDVTTGEFCWPPQSGATQYEMVRSIDPSFSTACSRTVVTATCWMEAAIPPAGETFFYMNRVLTPIAGSFGVDSTGAERTASCP